MAKNDDATNPDTGAEVATTEPVNGTVAVRPYARLAEYLQSRAAVEASIVAEELTHDQMDAIMTATTPEELDAAMKVVGLTGLRDLENGTEFEIHSWHVSPNNKAEFSNKLGVWAVMNVTYLESGTTGALNTTVDRVIAYLRACEVMERFPLKVRVEKQTTGSGTDMITLLPVRERVTK